MMSEISQTDAILKAKCPRCRKGDIFVYPWYKYTKFHKFHKYCSECHFQFEIEPGFFFGAMYMSYAFVVALFITIGVVINLIMDEPGIMVYVVVINLAVLLFLPIIFRYSRVLYLYLFGGVSYEGNETQEE